MSGFLGGSSCTISILRAQNSICLQLFFLFFLVTFGTVGFCYLIKLISARQAARLGITERHGLSPGAPLKQLSK